MEKSVVFILSGILLDVVALALMKTLTQDMGIPDLVLVRSVLCMVILLGTCGVQGTSRSWIREELPYLALRALAGSVSFLLLIMALQELTLFTVLSLLHMAPVFAILAARVLYGSQMQSHHVLGMGASLIGCALFVYSGPQLELEISMVWGLLAAIVYGLALALTKKLQRTSSVNIQLVYNMTCMVVVLPFIDVSALLSLSVASGLILGVVALVNIAMNDLYIRGYREGNVVVLSILEYLSIPIGALVGFFVWGDIPHTPEITAGGLIILGGIIAISKRKRETLSG